MAYSFVGKCLWRNVEWVFVSSSYKAPRKTIVKKFVNTDRQEVEDIGGNTDSFQVKGYVTELFAPIPSDEREKQFTDIRYIEARNALREALKKEGTGTFNHPLYGPIQDCKAVDWVIEESISELGIGHVSVDFEISNSDGAPLNDITTVAEISSLNGQALKAINEDIKENVNTDTGLLGTYASTKAKVQEMADKFESALEFAEKTSDGIESVSNAVADFGDKVASLTSAPVNLADSVTSLFETINGGIANAVATYQVYEQFFGFGFLTDVELRFNTVANNTSKLNNHTLNNAMNIASMSGALLAASQKNYRTVEEIDIDVAGLESQIELLIDAEDVDPSALELLQQMRTLTYRHLDSLRNSVRRVVTISTPLTSSRGLSYRYYGNTDLSDDISDANESLGILLDGDVELIAG